MTTVAEVACVPVPDSHRGEEVKALIVLQPGASPEDLPPARVLEHCRQGLAPFKVPRYVGYVAALPKTGSNKIAKAELRKQPDPTAGCYDALEQRWLT